MRTTIAFTTGLLVAGSAFAGASTDEHAPHFETIHLTNLVLPARSEHEIHI